MENTLKVFTSFSGYDSQCLALRQVCPDAEEWRDVTGYVGQYQVSNTGKVRSLPRLVYCEYKGTPYHRTAMGRELKPKRDKDGYLMVNLGRKTMKVHRLVAREFCDGYAPNKQVNHKDENPANNNADNLEWCSHIYNQRYGGHSTRSGAKHRKQIIQTTLTDEFVQEFDSIKAAEQSLKIKGASTPIVRCCKGQKKQAYGYKWKYK